MLLTAVLTKSILCKREVAEMSNAIRRNMPLLPISIVMQLTDLTARQIRYYEEHELVQPHRTEGNRRMFSLNDVDILLEIKELLEQGVNLAGIKHVFALKEEVKKSEQKELSDTELRKVLRDELRQAQSMQKTSIRQGDLSRFYQ